MSLRGKEVTDPSPSSVQSSVAALFWCLESGNEADRKCYIKLTGSDADFRSKCASRPEIWQLLHKQLQTSLLSRNAAESSDVSPLPAPPMTLLLLANNLSATENAGGASRKSCFGNHLAKLVFATEKETRLQWQILANLSQGMRDDAGLDLEDMVSAMGNVHALFARCASALKPVFLFLSNALRLSSDGCLRRALIEQELLTFLLDNAPQWFDQEGNELDLVIKMTLSIMLSAIERGLLPILLDTARHTLPHRVTLFKLVDSVLASKLGGSRVRDPEFWSLPQGDSFSTTVKTEFLENNVLMIRLINSGSRSDETAQLRWSLHCVLLDLLVLVTAHQSETVLDQLRHDLLHELIALLKAAKTLPSKSKLKNMTQNGADPVDSADFPYLKSAVIPAITSLVKGSPAAQDEMRVSGGLNAVLESCVIDANNPFMKERAIVCIRYLLENNTENQQFVASMEARQVADPSVLAEAGYEAEFIDGKLKLKNA